MSIDMQYDEILLQQYVDKILILLQLGFFEMRNGSIVVHFGNEGTIKKIERHNVFTV